jgi:hypothetical protein
MKAMISIILDFTAGIVLFGCDKGDHKELAPKTTDYGTGLNAVERTYARPAKDLVDVVAACLKSFELHMESDTHDELGGSIVALRADGHKVTAKISSVDRDHSQISIRVAPGNRNLADLIHERIAERLSASPTK